MLEWISYKEKISNELNPKIRAKPNGGVFFMKMSYEDKVRMYRSSNQKTESRAEMQSEDHT
jgi:hypothetical protein